MQLLTNATATKTVSVNVTLFDVFGTEVSGSDAVPIGPRDSFIQVFPSLRPLSCVVDVLGGQDANLVRVVLVNTDGNDNEKGHEVTSGFLEAPEDAAVIFDLIEKTFDEMEFFVQMPIAGARIQAVEAGRNHRLNAPNREFLDECSRVIALVAEHCVRRKLAVRRSACSISDSCQPV
jgi:hypothetical protein